MSNSAINYFSSQYSAFYGNTIACKTKAEQIKSVKSDLFWTKSDLFWTKVIPLSRIRAIGFRKALPFKKFQYYFFYTKVYFSGKYGYQTCLAIQLHMFFINRMLFIYLFATVDFKDSYTLIPGHT